MRRAHWIAALIVLLIGGAGAWAWLSPGLTLRAMMSAAEANDADRLSAYIDYQALRRDMKADLTSRLEAEARKAGGRRGKIGVAVGKALIGPMVDSMASPQGMKAALAAIKAGDAARARGAAGEPPEPAIVRESLGRFLVRNPATPDSALVFERRGLGWKLVGVDLGEPDARGR